MTLTKYQRGDAIEGWNDCPTPVMMSKNNSTISLGETVRRNREETMELCDKVFTLPIQLPERELTHHKQKLQTQIQTMNETHLHFLATVFHEVIEGTIERKELANQVVEYMMAHEGVASWCSPLKKIVSKV
ncbi:hypothetical protein LELG_05050 [Lodderomyces elongisporus NRRL YB-4239]|uniref:Uncharacterized protein n=1 Tax=Lodderomyces elongisporus (strain ATCC 11503 / CBS 2605 / JCM 1781 / NBRC 1676 / NRRL YB-4239) TaxID=379508 RepID=A5E611_LODEL|nr:hypothetical protein LELG_05050 [Lodderomyces elongisporus NRRL YB-4239]